MCFLTYHWKFSYFIQSLYKFHPNCPQISLRNTKTICVRCTNFINHIRFPNSPNLSDLSAKITISDFSCFKLCICFTVYTAVYVCLDHVFIVFFCFFLFYVFLFSLSLFHLFFSQPKKNIKICVSVYVSVCVWPYEKVCFCVMSTSYELNHTNTSHT